MTQNEQGPMTEALNQLSQTWENMNTPDSAWTAETTLRSILTEEEVTEFMAIYGSNEETAGTALEMLDSTALKFMEIASKFLGVKGPRPARTPEREAIGQAMDMKASRFSFFSLRLLNDDQLDNVLGEI